MYVCIELCYARCTYIHVSWFIYIYIYVLCMCCSYTLYRHGSQTELQLIIRQEPCSVTCMDFNHLYTYIYICILYITYAQFLSMCVTVLLYVCDTHTQYIIGHAQNITPISLSTRSCKAIAIQVCAVAGQHMLHLLLKIHAAKRTASPTNDT